MLICFQKIRDLFGSKRPGMSLVEVLIGLTILSVALLSLSKMPIMTTKLMTTSIHHEEAALIALRRLEFLEGSSFDAEVLSGDQAFDYALDGVSRDFFSCSYTVDDDVFDGNAKFVVINVSWDGEKHNVEMSKIISRFASRTVEDNVY